MYERSYYCQSELAGGTLILKSILLDIYLDTEVQDESSVFLVLKKELLIIETYLLKYIYINL